MIGVRRAVGRDWQRSRDIRLRALREEPLAFASTYQREVGLGAADWQHRIADAAQFLAEDERGAVVGTATGVADPEVGALVHLVAMYVAPEVRGRGVGAALVAAVLADAAAAGAHEVRLQVVETNTVAERLYQRCGFVRTGASAPLPHRPELAEHEMLLSLPPGVGGST